MCTSLTLAFSVLWHLRKDVKESPSRRIPGIPTGFALLFEGAAWPGWSCPMSVDLSSSGLSKSVEVVALLGVVMIIWTRSEDKLGVNLRWQVIMSGHTRFIPSIGANVRYQLGTQPLRPAISSDRDNVQSETYTYSRG